MSLYIIENEMLSSVREFPRNQSDLFDLLYAENKRKDNK